jgi:hypothetical protein
MSGRNGRPLWPALFVASLLIVAVADAVVLHLTKAYFGSGYNTVAVRTPHEVALFFLAGCVIDVALLAPAWLALDLATRRVRGTALALLVATTLLSTAPILIADVALNRLHRVLGDVIALRVLWELAAGDLRNVLAEVAPELPGVAAFAGAGLLGVAAAVWLAARAPALGTTRTARPRAAALAALWLAGVLAAPALLAGLRDVAPAVAAGLAWKPSGLAISSLAELATDFDRDGSGLFARPLDCAPFDGERGPRAVERPGNGIDDDCLGGDLPEGLAAPEPMRAALPTTGRRPRAFVLVFLESFRPDVIGWRHAAVPVTPNLDALAAAGAASSLAYAHTPFTWPSRAQMFQGELVPRAGRDTLVDDFHALGYEVAYFSGQHDGLNDSEGLLGLPRADYFYDARADVERRTSRSTEPISLQVSWKRVAARLDEYLAARDAARPLFLYVNLVDTHFPYWHPEMDAVVDPEPMGRDEIHAGNRERVWLAYLNAAANVDRGIAHVLRSVERHVGEPPAVVITGDHGQAFYERGQLGHGQALDDLQTRVPLVVRGLAGTWPEPVGLADLRALVRLSLASERPGPVRFERDPARALFQYVLAFEAPFAVGLRSATGIVGWRLSRERAFSFVRGDGALEEEGEPAPDAAREAVRAWELLRIRS